MSDTNGSGTKQGKINVNQSGNGVGAATVVATVEEDTDFAQGAPVQQQKAAQATIMPDAATTSDTSGSGSAKGNIKPHQDNDGAGAVAAAIQQDTDSNEGAPVQQQCSDDSGRASSTSSTAAAGPTASPALPSKSTQGNMNPLAQPFSPNNQTQQAYKICEIQHKGKGFLATRFLPAGTLILAEAPLLTANRGDLFLACIAYQNLSQEQKLIYDKLHYFKPETLDLESAARTRIVASMGGDEDREKIIAKQVRVLGIFAVNNWSHREYGLAVYENVSRINHSCVPNAYGGFNETTRTFDVYAIADIQADEEITLNYNGHENDHSIRADRVQHFRDEYGFTCHCPACNDGTGVSDGRRQALARIVNGLNGYDRNVLDPVNVPMDQAQVWEFSQGAISAMNQEGLRPLRLAIYYIRAAQAAFWLEDFNGALMDAFTAQNIERNAIGTETSDLEVSAQSFVTGLVEAIVDKLGKEEGKDLVRRYCPGYFGEEEQGKGKGKGKSKYAKKKERAKAAKAAKERLEQKKAREAQAEAQVHSESDPDWEVSGAPGAVVTRKTDGGVEELSKGVAGL